AAAALQTASQPVRLALALALFSAVATSRTSHMLAINTAIPDALTSGFQTALFAASTFLLVAAVIATRTTNTKGEARSSGDNENARAAAAARLQPEGKGPEEASIRLATIPRRLRGRPR